VRQTFEEVCAGMDAAWRFFGGVPRRVVLDNFPAAIAGPDALDPRPTRLFVEYSQACGFLIDAARPAHPKDGSGARSVAAAQVRLASFALGSG